MSKIAECISKRNKNGQKSLTIFLTAGFPNKDQFLDAAKRAVDSGADILEIGVPFGDSLADGPVIQSSYYSALEQNIKVKDVLTYTEMIKKEKEIPIVIMGAANPINNYGISNFITDAKSAGADGIIVPDVSLEEYETFFGNTENNFDKILLTTPTSSSTRIEEIDNLSSGFVYCVSVVGTTGIRQIFSGETLKNLERTYKLVKKNKMQIGFGIAKGDDVIKFKDYCDGVIVGSAVIKLLSEKNGVNLISELISELREGCNFK